jgi:hypothetical protein
LGGASTFLDSLYNAKIINQRLFSLYFGSVDFVNGTGSNSRLFIGEVDNGTYSDGNLIYLPVYKPIGLWSVQISAVMVGPTHFIPSSDIAVLNSTSFYLSTPITDANVLFQVISSSGDCWPDAASELLLCDCGMKYSIRDYPDIVLTLGPRAQFTLRSTDYFWQKPEGCYALIDGNSTNWVLGTAFMRAYYTVYDVDNERIGFAGSIAAASGRVLAIVGVLVLLWSE